MIRFSFQSLVKFLKKIVYLYGTVFFAIWLLFFLDQTLLQGLWNSFGIAPRTLSFHSLIGVFLSWTMHKDITHIVNNSIVLAQLLIVFGILEKHVVRLMVLLILGSGIATWLLGAPGSIHIGASGLAFAMFGYMLSSAVLARKWEYVLVCVLLGLSFWLSVLQGLVPKQGVSFAGHFGGIVSGIVIGTFYNIKESK